ncbi:MAG: hypothetical protein FWC51_00840 [Proteobacteria bacterium]|nr:hypothetical protein [Pseudomonadota bacterium]
MFYKIWFYLSLIAVLAGGWAYRRMDATRNVGAQSWVGMYSTSPTDTAAFLQRVFGTRTNNVRAADPNMDYILLTARRQFWPFGGVMTLPPEFSGAPHTMAYLTTLDFEVTHREMILAGARAIMSPRVVGSGRNRMKYGIYIIPGGIEIGVAQYRGIR